MEAGQQGDWSKGKRQTGKRDKGENNEVENRLKKCGNHTEEKK